MNDVSLLNPVRVSQIVAPVSTEDVQRHVGHWRGPISIGGACHSMGGQIAAADSLHFDMRSLNRLRWLDPRSRRVRVQTGMRWRDLQSLIDPHGLAVKIMQSYSNFTIGGALSVNAHGRYVGLGPLINSVRSIQIVLPGGAVAEADPAKNADLFHGAIGGYGGLGVITEVELDLVPNVRMERVVDRMPMAQYPAYFFRHVRNRADAIFHNADYDPYFPDQAVATTWFETEQPATIADRLTVPGNSRSIDILEIRALADLPGAHFIRRRFFESASPGASVVAWRNHEASLDVASLGPMATRYSTFALQEYFVPIPAFAAFVEHSSQILRHQNVNALNISIRHSPEDQKSTLAWARKEVFSFVLYYRQHVTPEARRHVQEWTRQLIDAALSLGGTYYLPYQLSATRAQFERAYPGSGKFLAVKSKVDPRNQFSNKLLEKYLRV